MKKVLLLWLVLAIGAQNEVFSQRNINVDSLIGVVESYPRADTIKVKKFLELASAIQNYNPGKAMECVEASIRVSEQLGDAFWLGKAYLRKSSIGARSGDLENAQADCQKAVDWLGKDKKHPDDWASSLMQLGSIAAYGGDYVTALKHYESALSIFEATQNVKQQVSVLAGMGSANYTLGNHEKALELLQKGVKKNEVLNDKANFRLLYTNIALVYYALGNYTLGLDYSLKTVAIAEQLGDLQALATEYNNISSIYFDLGEKEETQKYLHKSLALYHKSNDKIGVTRTMLNLCFLYDDHQKAVEELNKTVEYCKEIKNDLFLAYAYQSLALRHMNLKEYKNAYSYVQQVLDMEVQDNETLIKISNNAVEVLLNCSDSELYSLGIEPGKRYEKAKEHLDRAFAVGAQENSSLMLYTWQNLAMVQEKQQNYAQAYETYKKYMALKDTIAGDEVKKQITRKEIQYEFDKKETELQYQQRLTADELEKQRLLTVQQEQTLALNRQTLTLKEQALALSNKEKDLAHLAYLKEQAEKQEKEQELSLSQEREKGKERDLTVKNLEISAQQKQNIYLVAFVALLLSGLGALIYFYSTLKKQKNIIAQQNEINEHTISILSHDIKSPLLGVKILLKKLNKDDPFVAQAAQSLEDQISAVNGILNNLLRMKKVALSQHKNSSADVNTVLQNVLQELAVAIQAKGLTIQNEVTTDLSLPVAPEKLQVIFHNLLSNAIKYSFPNQAIRIFREGQGIAIQDFGVGLSPEQRSKLMRQVTASQEGTQRERGSGLGLFLVGAMLQGEAIKIVFDSPDVGGTIVKVLGG
jgi:signal transduction histidine kinase